MGLTLREQLAPFARGTQKACLRKVRYWNERQAARHAAAAMSLRPEKVYTYRCPHCGGWHLTRYEQ